MTITVSVIGTAAIVGTWSLASGYWSKFREFNEEFKDISNGHFVNRTLTEKLNLTYLYMYDNVKFNKVLADEHNKYFDMFKDDNIWDYSTNAPLICHHMCRDHRDLTSPQFRHDREQRQVTGVSHVVSLDNMKPDLSHIDDLYIRDNFLRGYQTSSYFLHHGIKFEDMFDWDKIKHHVPIVTSLLFKIDDICSDEYLQLTAVKTWIEQVNSIYFDKRFNGVYNITNTLSSEIRKQNPVLYRLIKLYYNVY